MVRRALIASVLVVLFSRPGEAAPPPVLRFPFWACSDGRGTISLFWLPVAGEWPAGGYRLERVVRGRPTLLAGQLRPGQDARAMMEIDPADADAVRSLAEKIERGTLTDDERSHSVSVLGRAASADAVLGRALGVRYTDVPRVRGKLVYRLTALAADGRTGSEMESAEVDPGRATPAPGKPARLRAEERSGGVALFWTDPPASAVAPVVGYSVNRAEGAKRMAALAGKPLLLDRHLRPGEPEFLDGTAPAKKLTYQVRSVDVFGRLSDPVRVGIAVKNAAPAKGPPAAAAKGPEPAAPPSAPPAAAPVATARAATGAPQPGAPRGDKGAPVAGPARDRNPAPAPAADPPPPSADDPGRVAPGREPAPPTEVMPAARIGSESAPPRPVPSPEAPQSPVWAAAKAEPAARQSGPPPPPVIVGIAGMADRVVVRFRPGEPEALTQAFLVIRSESPGGTGVTVGRPIPGDAREWSDSTVSAGQYFWYRLVAVDGAGNRSEPSKAKWVSTGSR